MGSVVADSVGPDGLAVLLVVLAGSAGPAELAEPVEPVGPDELAGSVDFAGLSELKDVSLLD